MSAPGLSTLLNYAHFIDEGIILNKDGAFLQTVRFRGPDIQSATSAELDAFTQHFNRCLTTLDDGWMIHIDILRMPSVSYPTDSVFPHSIAALIDEERRQHYQAAGEHYENNQFLTFVWKFPSSLAKQAQFWFTETNSQHSSSTSLTTLLNQFKEVVDHCLSLISVKLTVVKLSNAELLAFLHACLTGQAMKVTPPPDDCYLDMVLGNKTLEGGSIPRIDNHHIYALSITGYIHAATMPGLLEEMSAYPLVYRWSNRFIPLGAATAERELKRYQKNWNNKVKGLSGIIKETFSGKPSNKLNGHALAMSEEITEALTSNSNHSVRFGYWTSVIILIHTEMHLLEQAKKILREYLEQNGFHCHVETLNTLDAWLGSVPGHGACNARKLLIHSLNLSHILPLQSIWSGADFNSKNSLLPAQAPPVFYAATTGNTPFRFYLDSGDVGHQIILGPTGAGKSTYLDLLIVQFFRYQGAQIFIFDKDFSHRALTVALAGQHYNLGEENNLMFCPLRNLDSDSNKMRAIHFIENLVRLQNIVLTPPMRTAIHHAICSLAEYPPTANRSLTVLTATIQDTTVREALRYYTVDGTMKLLDSSFDSLQLDYLQTFEMNWLLSQKPEIYLPILFYIFDQIEMRLEPNRPTLIVMEEAWLYISQPLFADKLKDWLKTLRKKNARVIFATQSLTDLYEPTHKTLTAVTAVILESCPIKVFLPNALADHEMKNLYQKIGLNDRQIEIITEIAVAKQDYYVVTPEGNRLINLGLNNPHSVALAFIGLPLAQSAKLLACREKHRNEWVYFWLIEQGLPEWADYWRAHYFMNGGNSCAA